MGDRDNARRSRSRSSHISDRRRRNVYRLSDKRRRHVNTAFQAITVTYPLDERVRDVSISFWNPYGTAYYQFRPRRGHSPPPTEPQSPRSPPESQGQPESQGYNQPMRALRNNPSAESALSSIAGLPSIQLSPTAAPAPGSTTTNQAAGSQRASAVQPDSVESVLSLAISRDSRLAQ